MCPKETQQITEIYMWIAIEYTGSSRGNTCLSVAGRVIIWV